MCQPQLSRSNSLFIEKESNSDLVMRPSSHRPRTGVWSPFLCRIVFSPVCVRADQCRSSSGSLWHANKMAEIPPPEPPPPAVSDPPPPPLLVLKCRTWMMLHRLIEQADRLGDKRGSTVLWFRFFWVWEVTFQRCFLVRFSVFAKKQIKNRLL